MARTWIYQDPKQVAKHGTAGASWYAAWLEPDGKQRCKSCGKGGTGKRDAGRLAQRIASELSTGTYKDRSAKTWAEFRAEYDRRILVGMDSGNREETQRALAHFERIIKPNRMSQIGSGTIADFIATRRQEKGRSGPILSKATLNKDLRHLRAVLRTAHRWKYLGDVPDFTFVKEVKRLPSYVPPDHFVALYDAATAAQRPTDFPNVPAVDWWRGLLTFAYMTGWRIGEILDLKWADVDLEAGTALTRGDTNKGRRDVRIPLHPLVVEHLRKLQGTFDPFVFPWNHSERQLYPELRRIQAAAGVKPGDKAAYGFHDLRRGFATMNADRMSGGALQELMRHSAFATTQLYINMARQLAPAAANLFVPAIGGDRRKTEA